MMKKHLFSAASAAVLSLAAFPVFAADAQGDAAAPATNQAVEEVVVTGSRVTRLGFVAPTPVTTLTGEQLTQANPGSIGESLRQLPILSASAGTRGATGSAGSGGSFLNLRRLGGARTLTLLDGRRFVPSGGAGTVDTALFPQALIQRVEIVTGGASAAYGSDAVAGVVNFVLDKQYEGVKGEVMGGVSSRKDMLEMKATLSAGTSFGGGRGHFLASAEFFENDGLYDRLQRPFGEKSCAQIANPSAGVNGAPARLFACDVRASNANFAGLISTGPLRGTTFDLDSNPVPFNFGTFTTSTTQVGGDGIKTQFTPLQVPIKRRVLFSRASWELTPDITAYLEGSYAAALYDYQIGSYSNALGSNALTIFRDNAYITPAFRQQLTAANVSSFRLGRYSRDMPRTWIENHYYVTRFVGGLDGKFAGADWHTYWEHGENRQGLDAYDDLIIDRYQEASDAVLAPGGKIVCRSTLTAPGNGCVPVNVLGEHGVTPEQLAYITGHNWTTAKSVEDVVSFDASRDIFSTWAGPVSLAAGAEWRKESVRSRADPNSLIYSKIADAPGPYRVGNYLSQNGQYTVYEGFAETVVPLAKDMPLAQELEFNGAVRRTHYSTSGGVTTWKAGLTWRPADFIRFRGTRSRDIRAPNLTELFNAGTTGHSPTFLDQFYSPPRTLNQVLNITRGNPNLQPEKADTLTFGAVLTPSFIPGLDISADVYDIEIDGAIATVGASQATLDCRNGSADACSRVVRDAAGNVTTTYTIPINLQVSKSRGADFEISYRMPLSRIVDSWNGDLNMRFLGNYVDAAYTVAPGAIVVDRTGDASQPKWRWSFNLGYRNGPLSVSTTARYSGEGPFNSSTLANDLVQRDIPGIVVVDARVNYDFTGWKGGDYTAYFSVNNVFDKFPPIFGDEDQGDSVGRYFRVGLLFKY